MPMPMPMPSSYMPLVRLRVSLRLLVTCTRATTILIEHQQPLDATTSNESARTGGIESRSKLLLMVSQIIVWFEEKSFCASVQVERGFKKILCFQFFGE